MAEAIINDIENIFSFIIDPMKQLLDIAMDTAKNHLSTLYDTIKNYSEEIFSGFVTQLYDEFIFMLTTIESTMIEYCKSIVGSAEDFAKITFNMITEKTLSLEGKTVNLIGKIDNIMSDATDDLTSVVGSSITIVGGDRAGVSAMARRIVGDLSLVKRKFENNLSSYFSTLLSTLRTAKQTFILDLDKGEGIVSNYSRRAERKIVSVTGTIFNKFENTGETLVNWLAVAGVVVFTVLLIYYIRKFIIL